MPNLEQEFDQFITNVISDFSDRNLKAIASYFHLSSERVETTISGDIFTLQHRHRPG